LSDELGSAETGLLLNEHEELVVFFRCDVIQHAQLALRQLALNVGRPLTHTLGQSGLESGTGRGPNFECGGIAYLVEVFFCHQRDCAPIVGCRQVFTISRC
jgi:hypothetical protein